MRQLATASLLLAAAVPAAGAGASLHAQAPAQAQGPKRASAPVAVLQAGPDVGRRAPDFTLPWASHEGVGPDESPYQLWGDLGKTVVLVFYSQAFTKSATTTMQTFADQYDRLFGPDVVVLGISTDPPETASRFAAQLRLPFRLLSDEGQKVAKKYGTRNSRGQQVRRSVFVIGPDGKIRYRNMRFDPFNGKSYAAVGAAVRAAQVESQPTPSSQ